MSFPHAALLPPTPLPCLEMLTALLRKVKGHLADGRQEGGGCKAGDAQPGLQETRGHSPSLALGLGKAKRKARCSLSGRT